MSTRNFVPRSGSEGQLGTQAKPWGVVVADIGHFATLSGSISGSQYSTGSFGRLHVAGDSNINGDVTIGGNISIGYENFVGGGVIIYPGVKISNNCKIVAGSSITKNVVSNSFVYGNPAKIVKNYIED